MIGHNIKKLRTEQGMTQKELADKLFVSAQAVSRWENNEVEPSIGTITKLAKIFGVSADEILGIDSSESSAAPEPEVIIEKEYVYKEPPKQSIALCVKCNSPIYESSDICRDYDGKIFCKKCYEKGKQDNLNSAIKKAKKRRILSFVLSPLVSIILLICFIVADAFSTPLGTLSALVYIIGGFTFLSCCLFSNNFVGEMAITIFSWGFVKMPGIIFTLDLDGCLFFIGVKILFAIIGFLLGVLFTLLAIFIGCLVSLFVYPYALIKNLKRPEETEL